MSTLFNVTPHDKFGVEYYPGIIKLQIQIESSILIDNTDTKASLVDKLKASGRIESVATADNFEVQRDDNVIQFYASEQNRSDRILLIELVKADTDPPLTIRRTPNRDGDDLNTSDLGER